jgi:large subunit ribosomal protein L21
MYAIVKTGGKQYRVEQGTSLLVERLRADQGAKVALEPLLLVDGEKLVEGDSGVKVEARVVGHERGPKLRVVKFKPKRGYKRRNGHRQELTRLEVTSIKGPAARARRAPAEAKAESAPAEKPAPRRRPPSQSADKPAPRRSTASKSADKPAARGRATADKPAPRRRPTPKKEAEDGS